MGIFNVGTGKEIQIREIVNLISKKFKDSQFIIGDKPYRHGVYMHFYSSINKINNAIGWVPKWKIEDGIDMTIKWWLNNRDKWIKYKQFWEKI